MQYELFCLTVIIYSKSLERMAWVALSFILPASLYRLVGSLFEGRGYCPCLGSLTGWWPWFAVRQTAVLNVIAFWLFLISILVLWRLNGRVAHTAQMA